MNLVEILKQHQQDCSPEQRQKVTETIATFVDMHSTEQDQVKLYKDIYSILGNGHYNEYFAKQQIGGMYFVDDKDVEHRAPYYTDQKAREMYEVVKDEIRPYNENDFAVVLNMIYSDNYNLLKRWFPELSEEQLTDKVVDMSVEWLKDDDNPYGTCKAWGYFNS